MTLLNDKTRNWIGMSGTMKWRSVCTTMFLGIDEYQIIVNPVILGGGKPSFGDVKYRLKLLETRTFSCGYAILLYHSLKN